MYILYQSWVQHRHASITIYNHQNAHLLTIHSKLYLAIDAAWDIYTCKTLEKWNSLLIVFLSSHNSEEEYWRHLKCVSFDGRLYQNSIMTSVYRTMSIYDAWVLSHWRRFSYISANMITFTVSSFGIIRHSQPDRHYGIPKLSPKYNNKTWVAVLRNNPQSMYRYIAQRDTEKCTTENV